MAEEPSPFFHYPQAATVCKHGGHIVTFRSHKLQSAIARVPEKQQNKKQKYRASNVPQHLNGALRFSDQCFCNASIPHSLMNRLPVLNLVLLDTPVSSSQSIGTGYPDVPPVHRSMNKCYLSLSARTCSTIKQRVCPICP